MKGAVFFVLRQLLVFICFRSVGIFIFKNQICHSRPVICTSGTKVSSGNHRKAELVSLGHKLIKPVKMTGNVYNVLVCFPLFFSLDLFIIMKIVKDSHDFTQGHVTFPMNASCFCHLPILWQMTCSQSCTLSPLLSLNCCLEL